MAYPYALLYEPTSTGTLTNTQYISEHQNHINNNIPESIDDYSASVSEMRIQTDPGEASSESLATTLSEEIERLRFAIKESKQAFDSQLSYWYETPTANSIVRTADADVFKIYAKADTYTNTILKVQTDEENTGSFFFLKCISDVNGTPSTEFSVDQDGNLASNGTVTVVGNIVSSSGGLTVAGAVNF